MLFVLRVFYFFKKDRHFARSLFSSKLILAAVSPIADSLFFGKVEISSSKLTLAAAGPTNGMLKKLISTPVYSSHISE